MAFKIKKASRKKKTQNASLVLKNILKRIRRGLNSKIKNKLMKKAKEMNVSLTNTDIEKAVEFEINKLLVQEKASIEKAAVQIMKNPEMSDAAVGSILSKIENRLGQIESGMIPSPLMNVPSGKQMPIETDIGGKKLSHKINAQIQIDKPKIGTNLSAKNEGGRYMVPYGYMAPMFNQMTGPQIIEKVQELYHVPFEAGAKLKQKIRETYPLIPENPKQGEKVSAWAYIHWEQKSKELIYELVEPKLSKFEKQLLDKLEDKLEEKLDILFVPKGKGKHKTYLRKKIKEVVNLFGWKMSQETASKIEYYAFRDFIGFGKIEALMHDQNIEDISCDGVNIPLYIFHRKPEYNQMKTNIYFTDKEELDSFAIRLAQKSGRSISVAAPLLDASLPDGSRLQCTLGSDIARRGSNFTIRKFLKEPLTPPKLVDFGTSSSLALAYIWMCVEYGKSILVSGTTATGKTSFLNAISLFIRPELKVVSIEDTAELMLSLPNWVPHVARQGYGGKEYGSVDMFALLKASLRQRPDYVIVGEVRGAEASVMFQGMATGHPALATIHADSLQRLVDRLTTPPINLSAALMENLDIVIFLVRTKTEGKFIRRINRVYEIAGVNVRDSKIIPNKLFEWDPVKDEINHTGKSLILKKISDFKGIKYEVVFKEIERRSLFIDWLKTNNIFNFTQFNQWIASYYAEPDKVMERVINDVRRKLQTKNHKVGNEKLHGSGK